MPKGPRAIHGMKIWQILPWMRGKMTALRPSLAVNSIADAEMILPTTCRSGSAGAPSFARPSAKTKAIYPSPGSSSAPGTRGPAVESKPCPTRAFGRRRLDDKTEGARRSRLLASRNGRSWLPVSWTRRSRACVAERRRCLLVSMARRRRVLNLCSRRGRLLLSCANRVLLLLSSKKRSVR